MKRRHRQDEHWWKRLWRIPWGLQHRHLRLCGRGVAQISHTDSKHCFSRVLWHYKTWSFTMLWYQHHVIFQFYSSSFWSCHNLQGWKGWFFSPPVSLSLPVSPIMMWLLKIKLKWYKRHPSDSSGGLILKGAHWLSFLHMSFFFLSPRVSESEDLPFPDPPAPHSLT